MDKLASTYTKRLQKPIDSGEITPWKTGSRANHCRGSTVYIYYYIIILYIYNILYYMFIDVYSIICIIFTSIHDIVHCVYTYMCMYTYIYIHIALCGEHARSDGRWSRITRNHPSLPNFNGYDFDPSLCVVARGWLWLTLCDCSSSLATLRKHPIEDTLW